MLLRVRGPEGQTTLKLEPGATVAALKALLEEQTGVAAAYQEASAGCCDACWVLTWALGAHDLGAHERLVVQLSGAPPCCRQPPNDSCPFSQLDPCTLVDCSGPPTLPHFPACPTACHTSFHVLLPGTHVHHQPMQVRAGFPPRPLAFPSSGSATVGSLGLQSGDSLTVTQKPGTKAAAHTTTAHPPAAARAPAQPAVWRHAIAAAAAAGAAASGSSGGSKSSICCYCFESLSPFQRHFCLTCCPSAAGAVWHACHECAVQHSASGGLPSASKASPPGCCALCNQMCLALFVLLRAVRGVPIGCLIGQHSTCALPPLLLTHCLAPAPTAAAAAGG